MVTTLEPFATAAIEQAREMTALRERIRGVVARLATVERERDAATDEAARQMRERDAARTALRDVAAACDVARAQSRAAAYLASIDGAPAPRPFAVGDRVRVVRCEPAPGLVGGAGEIVDISIRMRNAVRVRLDSGGWANMDADELEHAEVTP